MSRLVALLGGMLAFAGALVLVGVVGAALLNRLIVRMLPPARGTVDQMPLPDALPDGWYANEIALCQRHGLTAHILTDHGAECCDCTTPARGEVA